MSEVADVTESSLLIASGSRRGRPPVPDPLVPVTMWISREHHDRLIKLANLHDMSVSALGRKVVERAVDRAMG